MTTMIDDVPTIRTQATALDLSEERLLRWPNGVQDVGGRPMMADAQGRLVPVALVKPVDKLMDETVRKIVAFALDLEAQIARFRGHCFEDVADFQALIAQEYEASVGGRRGNVTLTSFDGLQKVQIQVADLLAFGPELQAAKRLVDDCLTDWSAGAGDELRSIVTRAFQVDKEGRVNRAEIFMLLRVQIEDSRWIRAMDAVRDSIRVLGSKTYIRFYRRESVDQGWSPISIDLASARGAEGAAAPATEAA